jgi:hypothetical protein
MSFLPRKRAPWDTPRIIIYSKDEEARNVEFDGIASHKSFIGRGGSGQGRA